MLLITVLVLLGKKLYKGRLLLKYVHIFNSPNIFIFLVYLHFTIYDTEFDLENAVQLILRLYKCIISFIDVAYL